MHGDLVNKHNNSQSKKSRGLARVKMTAETPPGEGARQVLYLAVVGFVGVLMGIAMWLEVASGLLHAIMIAVWVGSIPCAGVALWRGKFELEAIDRGHSPVRGKTFAQIGFFGGAGALVVAVILLVVIIVGAFGGGGEIAVDSSAEGAARKFAAAIIEGNFDEYKAMLSAKKLKLPEDMDEEDFEKMLKVEFDRLHKEDFADMEVDKVMIESIDETTVKATLFLKGTKDKDDKSNLKYTLVKEDDGWKVE